MPPTYAALWDMDGTLVDTAELHFQAWTALLTEVGHPFGREDFHRTFGLRNPEIFRILCGDRFDDEAIARLGDRKEVLYRAAARHGVELLPGARSLLDGLHAVGFGQAIGSSAPRANLELILELTQTRALFQAVVGMEDTRRGKPDPEVFLVAASRLGVPPARCLVFEDAVAGVQAARAAGMRCVAVRFAGHHAEEALHAAGADAVVANLAEVSPDTVHALLQDGCQ